MRIDHLAVLDRLDLIGVRLHHVERPGLAPLPADVDQDQRVVAAHDLVGEVEAAGAEVEHADPVRELGALEPLGDEAAEGVVLHPRVADAGDQDLLRRRLLICGAHGPIASSSSPLKNR